MAAGLSAKGFRRLLDTVAAGWNEGDARRAADCFADDAVKDGMIARWREYHYTSELEWPAFVGASGF